MQGSVTGKPAQQHAASQHLTLCRRARDCLPATGSSLLGLEEYKQQ